MNINQLAPIVLSLLCASASAFAADGSISISSPANGTMVSAGKKIPVVYEAALGPSGDHLHLYVDGNRVDVLREKKGSAELDALPAGKHHICLTVNTKSHAPTGVESCIDVTAQ